MAGCDCRGWCTEMFSIMDILHEYIDRKDLDTDVFFRGSDEVLSQVPDRLGNGHLGIHADLDVEADLYGCVGITVMLNVFYGAALGFDSWQVVVAGEPHDSSDSLLADVQSGLCVGVGAPQGYLVAAADYGPCD